ncbi:MAG TPA: C1 family peptidase [Elusimicrobiales bacterium]|nr:C1 family peptidase [Elusimicrobiales bacterium]
MNKHIKNGIAGLAALVLFMCGSGASFAKGLAGKSLNEQLDTVRKAIAQKKANWVAGETSLSNLSFEEQQRTVGLNFQLPNVPPLPENLLTSVRPPASVDWRALGVVGKVKNQGQCGSCWAFALTAGLESYVMRGPSGLREVDLSEQVMLSCSGVGSCNGGTLDGDFLIETGVPPADYFPYTAADTDCGEAKEGWKEKAYKIKTWGSVPRDLNRIKTALAQYGPVPTALWVYEDLMHYKSGVYSYTTGRKLGGHAVLLVGYNDAEHYFLAKNSWGTKWGEEGYFKVDYSQLNTVVTFGLMTIAYTSEPDKALALPTFMKLPEVDTELVRENSRTLSRAGRSLSRS